MVRACGAGRVGRSTTAVLPVEVDDWATEEELEAMDVATKKEVEEAVKFAEESPLPPVDELYLDVYKQKDYPFIKD